MPLHHHRATLHGLRGLSKPSHLHHLHLPDLTPYPTASAIQERIIQRHFAAKDALTRTRTRQDVSSSNPTLDAPPPTILTFSTPPTYTVGRRYLTTNPLPASQISYLQGLSNGNSTPLAAFHPSPRGGDLTYHAPGQLTAYAIIDLRTHNVTPRCYVRLLESTIIRTCARLGVPNTRTTEDPGVWISEPASSPGPINPPDAEAAKATDRKICALGVQIRRGITGHGIGLNVHDHPAPPPYANESGAGYLTWGFSRVVACGLEGKSVTWLTREGTSPALRVEAVGRAFAEEFANALDLGQGQKDGAGTLAVREITLGDIEGW